VGAFAFAIIFGAASVVVVGAEFSIDSWSMDGVAAGGAIGVVPIVSITIACSIVVTVEQL
jgi:hypothetical protein